MKELLPPEGTKWVIRMDSGMYEAGAWYCYAEIWAWDAITTRKPWQLWIPKQHYINRGIARGNSKYDTPEKLIEAAKIDALNSWQKREDTARADADFYRFKEGKGL